jgi:putative heme-binding domain-containing protein
MQRETGRLLQALEEGHGDPYKGKQLYATACAACHQLFDDGGSIGPELTSFDRRDVASLLLAIVNPSAEIREGYENFSIVTKDGRSLGGFIVEQNERRVILRGYDGQDVVLAREDIAVLDAAGISLMPEGLIDGYDNQQIADLFSYLNSLK